MLNLEFLAIFMLFAPFIAFLSIPLGSYFFTIRNTINFSICLLIISVICSFILFLYSGIQNHIMHIILSKWFTIFTFDIHWSLYIDQLTSLICFVVSVISLVVHLYSLEYMKYDSRISSFLSYISLFTFFMFFLVISDNFLQFFLGWEGMGLCSYLLIGFWYKKTSANNAAIKAFIVNRIGDIAFILAIIIIIIYFKSLDFLTVFNEVNNFSKINFLILGYNIRVINLLCIFLVIAAMAKSAQIFFHIWLPDAMEGPTPASALIHAATMVTAGVFLLVKCSYFLEYSEILNFIAFIGASTALFAAFMAFVQNDLKKIIAYSTCSQLGYMFIACGVSAYNAAIFHLITHAFFKSLLFLLAGNVIHVCHEQNITKIGGIRKKMPYTYSSFILGVLALIGIYPFSGFYSKDLILELTYVTPITGKMLFGIGIIAALLTSMYAMKIIILVFHGRTSLDSKKFNTISEVPDFIKHSLAPLIFGSMFAGMIANYILSMNKINGFFAESIYNVSRYKLLALHPPLFIKVLPLFIGGSGILLTVLVYKGSNTFFTNNFIYSLKKKRNLFDAVYIFLFVRPLEKLSYLLFKIDIQIIDRYGPNGIAKLTIYCSNIFSKIQTGYIFNYMLYIIVFMIFCITYSILALLNFV